MQRDPARISAHHFENHHAVVRSGGRVQAVERFGRNIDGGHKSEGQLGGRKVVVDRFRNADDGKAALAKLVGDRQRAFAADDDHRFDFELFEIIYGFFNRHLGKNHFSVDDLAKTSAIARAEYRAAARQNSADRFQVEFNGMSFA
jgi:hypothetical protein